MHQNGYWVSSRIKKKRRSLEMKVENIAIIGAGTMGNGIAQTAAIYGYKVAMTDVIPEAIEKGKSTIRKSVDKLAEKGMITEDQKDSALKISTSLDLEPVKKADLVIEAVSEDVELKLKLFSRLDQIAPRNAIIASNTSSISLTKRAGATSRPDKVIGMHFFNPVPLMKLLEVIRGIATSDETTQTILEVGKKLGKEPVEAQDSPGFISNRILCPMINEAIFVLQEGIGTREAIDTVLKSGMNHPMGPLALADLIGLDVVLNVLEVLHRDLGEDKYRPAALLRKMVDAGYLGRKTSKGFYEYR
jgi:3-hydroxybutyryl-CoA dehydrogenase